MTLWSEQWCALQWLVNLNSELRPKLSRLVSVFGLSESKKWKDPVSTMLQLLETPYKGVVLQPALREDGAISELFITCNETVVVAPDCSNSWILSLNFEQNADHWEHLGTIVLSRAITNLRLWYWAGKFNYAAVWLTSMKNTGRSASGDVCCVRRHSLCDYDRCRPL